MSAVVCLFVCLFVFVVVVGSGVAVGDVSVVTNVIIFVAGAAVVDITYCYG